MLVLGKGHTNKNPPCNKIDKFNIESFSHDSRKNLNTERFKQHVNQNPITQNHCPDTKMGKIQGEHI